MITNIGTGYQKSPVRFIIAGRLIKANKANKHTRATVQNCKYVSNVQEIVLSSKYDNVTINSILSKIYFGRKRPYSTLN